MARASNVYIFGYYAAVLALACYPVIAKTEQPHQIAPPTGAPQQPVVLPQAGPTINAPTIAAPKLTPPKTRSRWGLEKRHPNDRLITRTRRPVQLGTECPEEPGVYRPYNLLQSITGTLATGSTLTVTGQCFGWQPNPMRLVYSTPSTSPPYTLTAITTFPVISWQPNRIQYRVTEFERTKLGVMPPLNLIAIVYVEDDVPGASAIVTPEGLGKLRAGETITDLTTIGY
jgi:hypothetical protein